MKKLKKINLGLMLFGTTIMGVSSIPILTSCAPAVPENPTAPDNGTTFVAFENNQYSLLGTVLDSTYIDIEIVFLNPNGVLDIVIDDFTIESTYQYHNGYSFKVRDVIIPQDNGIKNVSIKSLTVKDCDYIRLNRQNDINIKSIDSASLNATFIGWYAFYECNIKSLDLSGNNLQTIDFGAFYNCTGLTTIKISKNLIGLQTASFKNVKNANVYLPSTFTAKKIEEAFGDTYNSNKYYDAETGQIFIPS